jgi:hypothetical protein
VEQKLCLLLAEKDSIGHEKDGNPPTSADVQKIREAWVDERLTHQMEANLLGEWGDLRNDPLKELDRHQLLCANDFRAEAALQVADIADLDIDLVKTTHDSNP